MPGCLALVLQFPGNAPDRGKSLVVFLVPFADELNYGLVICLSQFVHTLPSHVANEAGEECTAALERKVVDRKSARARLLEAHELGHAPVRIVVCKLVDGRDTQNSHCSLSGQIRGGTH